MLGLRWPHSSIGDASSVPHLPLFSGGLADRKHRAAAVSIASEDDLARTQLPSDESRVLGDVLAVDAPVSAKAVWGISEEDRKIRENSTRMRHELGHRVDQSGLRQQVTTIRVQLRARFGLIRKTVTKQFGQRGLSIGGVSAS